MYVASGWNGGPNFFVVGDIPGLPSIMFVDIHVERVHVNKSYEKLTKILTRTETINVYFTDIQHFIIFFTNVQKVKQKWTFVLTFSKYVSKNLCPSSLVFHLLNITVSLLKLKFFSPTHASLYCGW